MMRLPRFRYYRPHALGEAARILAGEGPGAMAIAGGTDLIPNMKRRQQTPRSLVALRGIAALGGHGTGDGARLGAGLTLAAIVADPGLRSRYRGLWQAAAQVATAQLRNLGTLGGNLCLDTRCTYYNQSLEWRRAIGYCLKKDGQRCWVATGSLRCLATSSSDTAPALIALGASVRLVSATDERELQLAALYRNDGIDYLTRRHDEILSEVRLPSAGGWRSTYWKLRRRGAFDFPVLGVAAALCLDAGGRVEQARIVLGAVACAPIVCAAAAEFLHGQPLTDDVIEAAAALCAKDARPVDNADFAPRWRKRVTAPLAGHALRELRGDDMSAVRRRISRQALD